MSPPAGSGHIEHRSGRSGPLFVRSGRGGGARGLGRREEIGRGGEFLTLDGGRREAETHLCQARGGGVGEEVVAAGWGGRSWWPAPLEPRRRLLLSDLGGGCSSRILAAA